MSVRIIPRLEIKGPNLVKGVHLEGLRVLGSPEEFARLYYEQGADELLYMDVVASLYQRNSLLEIVEKTSREIFVPLAVGGGLRSVEDIRKVLCAGADKVSLNTAAIRNPELVREAATRFGSSTIVVSIEAKKRPDGSYEAYIDCGRERTGVEVFQWAKRVAELGAGEIMITSIDREGTGSGFDLELTRRLAQSVPIPVIACGGAGSVAHVHEVIAQGQADAVALSSVLHYSTMKQRAANAPAAPSQPPGLPRGRQSSSKIQDISLPDLKAYLAARGVDCRHESEQPAHG
jgi:cyclase